MGEGLLASRWRGLMLLLIAGLAALSVRFACNRQRLADPLTGPGPRAAELLDTINPNTADWAALAALPGLGEKRAHEIVDHRQSWAAAHPGQARYRRLEDLRMPGIGDATLQKLAPYLRFSDTKPSPQTRSQP